MPKNKRDVELQVKREELLKTAGSLFMELGYEATSMAKIAKALEVAPNTLYWYFKSKDELLVGVLNELLQQGLAEFASISPAPLQQQVHWVLSKFENAKVLVSTVHARLDHSESIREWHDQFHQLMESMLVQVMVQKGVEPSKAQVHSLVGIFLIEGLLAHPSSAQQRNTIVDWFVETVSQ